jgi:hypothetical protein
MHLALFVDAAPRCAHDDTVQPQAETKHRRPFSEETLHTPDDALSLPPTAVCTQKPSTSPFVSMHAHYYCRSRVERRAYYVTVWEQTF